MTRLRPLLAAAAALGVLALSALPAQAGHRTGTWKYLPDGPPAYDHGYGRYDHHRRWRNDDGGDRWGYRPYRPAYARPEVWEDGGPARWNHRHFWLAPQPAWEDDDGWN